jgi:hypothetical protein
LVVWFMMLNAMVNNISVVSRWSVLLVEYTGKTTDLHKSLTNFITYCGIGYTSPWKGFELTTLAVIGTDCTGNCTSNYYAITTTMAPEQTSNDNNGIILFCNYFVLIDVDGVKEFNTLIRLVDRKSIRRWQTCQFNRT